MARDAELRFSSKLLRYSVIVVTLLVSSRARAHKDDYLDETLVYETIDAQVVALEFRSKYSGLSRDRLTPVFWVNSPFPEYGLTDSTMLEGQLSWGTAEGGRQFAGAFFQVRHRFGEEGKYLIDPAFALEYEAERNEDGRVEHFLVPILVASKDRGRFNVTGNILFKTKHYPGRGLDLDYALGFRYPRHGVRYGAELKLPDEHQRFILPSIQVPLRKGLSIKLGVGTVLNRSSPRVLAQALIEFEARE